MIKSTIAQLSVTASSTNDTDLTDLVAQEERNKQLEAALESLSAIADKYGI